MVSADPSNRHGPGSAKQAESRWCPRFFVSVALFLGIVGLLASAYAALSTRYGLRESPEEPVQAVSAQAAAAPKAAIGSGSPPSLESATPAPEHRGPTTPGLAQAPTGCPDPAAGSGALRRAAPNSAVYLSRRSPERLEEL